MEETQGKTPRIDGAPRLPRARSPQRLPHEWTRELPSLPDSSCFGCEACFNICPHGAISMRPGGDGFARPRVDAEACTGCMECERVCPAMRDTAPRDRDRRPAAFAAWSADGATRIESSSGGAFSALARAMFARGGAVFGAAFDESLVLRHVRADDESGLASMRGSKYLQSSIGRTYSAAKEILAGGGWVLFTGLPCQIAGLYGFLGSDRERLVTCDLACHGVPSPALFRKYVEEMEARQGSAAISVSFRDKRFGWKKFALRTGFADGSETLAIFRDDPYMRLFLAGLGLRESCADCAYSRLPRVADLSLADFWGVRRSIPDIDDADGVSLVMVNSSKGGEFFAVLAGGAARCVAAADVPGEAGGAARYVAAGEAADATGAVAADTALGVAANAAVGGPAAGAIGTAGLYAIPASMDDAIAYNPRIALPAGANPDRRKFFDRIGEISFAAAAEEFLPRKE